MTPYYNIRTAAIHASSRAIQSMSLMEKNIALHQRVVEEGPVRMNWMPRDHAELTDTFFLNALLPTVSRGPFALNDETYQQLPPDGDQA